MLGYKHTYIWQSSSWDYSPMQVFPSIVIDIMKPSSHVQTNDPKVFPQVECSGQVPFCEHSSTSDRQFKHRIKRNNNAPWTMHTIPQLFCTPLLPYESKYMTDKPEFCRGYSISKPIVTLEFQLPYLHSRFRSQWTLYDTHRRMIQSN